MNGVYAVTGSPGSTTVYAATGGGLSISTNGGSTFTNKTTTSGLGNNQLRGVYAVSGPNAATVYAATSNGLSISTDGGTSFANKTNTNGLGNNFVFGVYVVGSTVYAATIGGLSISTNGGNSFTNKTTTNGLGNNQVYGVYAVGSTVYAATSGGLSFCLAPPAAPGDLRRNTAAAYTPTDITLQWTDNSTTEDNFVLERGQRTSDSQVSTDNSIVWTVVLPDPAANATTYRDYSGTGLTANAFGWFYRIKAVNIGGSSAYAYNSDGALPVTLAYFNGRMTDAGALLGWETAREDNNAYFQIERSRDAVGFESIATIPSQAEGGNSVTELTYSYLDADPLPGINYYRLVQTDRDGTATRSKIIALTREDALVPVLYPNPVSVSGEAVLEPAIAHSGYQLTDVLGRVVQRVDAPGVLGRVSLAGLPVGVYVLRVQTESGPKVWRVLR